MSRLQTIENALASINETVFQELCDSFLILKNENYRAFSRVGSQSGKQKTIKGTPDTFLLLPNIFMGNEGVFAIILKEDNSLVGSIGIITDPKRENTRTRMLGYWLKECHWGKGMASEATRTILDYGFNVLGLHLISANCYPHNTRSRLLLERNGFIYEGILHEAEMTYDGHVYDHLCFYQKKERVPMD